MIFPWQATYWEQLAARLDRLPHALLIQARPGVGAVEFGRYLAQSLLCENRQTGGFACGACQACNWFGQGNHPDFRLVVPEALAPEAAGGEGEDAPAPSKEKKKSEQIRIDQVRELQGFLSVGTHRAGSRVVLLYPAETMNNATQNALLKSLEEPPKDTIFVLVTTRIERLLPTIRSRCQRIDLPVPPAAASLAWLKSKQVANPEAALAAAGGAPLAALEAGESDLLRDGLVRALADTRFDPVSAADIAQKAAPAQAVRWVQRWTYDLLSVRQSGRARYHVGQVAALKALAARCDEQELTRFFRRLTGFARLAEHPLNARLFVEDMLLQYAALLRGERWAAAPGSN